MQYPRGSSHLSWKIHIENPSIYFKKSCCSSHKKRNNQIENLQTTKPNQQPQHIPNTMATQTVTAVMNVDSTGLALEGNCPVAYFFGPPKKGQEEFSSVYQGVTYRFANGQAKGMFDAEPAKYMPQYGGWCGTGMAHGSLTPVDVTNYKIQDDKLILFFKSDEVDTKVMWDKDATLKPKADENWSTGNYAAKK